MKTARHPTDEDFRNGREFCSVFVEVGTDKLSARFSKRSFISQNARNRELRMSGHGTIDSIDLGELQCNSRSHCCFTGYVVDYVENADAALDQAILEAEKMRAKFIADCMAQIEKLKALPMVVTGKP
jgi:hypothetical protein